MKKTVENKIYLNYFKYKIETKFRIKLILLNNILFSRKKKLGKKILSAYLFGLLDQCHLSNMVLS